MSRLSELMLRDSVDPTDAPASGPRAYGRLPPGRSPTNFALARSLREAFGTSG